MAPLISFVLDSLVVKSTSPNKFMLVEICNGRFADPPHYLNVDKINFQETGLRRTSIIKSLFIRNAAHRQLQKSRKLQKSLGFSRSMR